MTYVDPDVITDEVTVAEAGLAGITGRLPGVRLTDGHPVTAQTEAFATIAATVAVLLKAQAVAGFTEGLATRVLRIQRQPAGVASALADIVLTDRLGHTVDDGTEFVMDTSSGTPVAFTTVGDIVVEAGSDTATGVPVVALEPGPEANGLVGEGRDHGVPFISSITLTTISSGGADEEDIEAYADRAADRATRLRALPVTPDDHAAMALDKPFVARAIAVNLLDLTGPTEDRTGHVSVFALDEAGAAIVGAQATELLNYLDGTETGDEKVMNVQVHVGTATLTDIDVVLSYVPEDGAGETVTTAAVEAVIAAYFDPALWSFDEAAAGLWENDGEPVRHFDVASVARAVDGVAHVATCTLNGGTSVTLTGYAPLPRLDVLTVTVA